MPKTNVKAKLIGANGNIYNLASIAGVALKDNGYDDLAKEMYERIPKSKNYDEALRIIMEYVDIE